MIWSVLHSIDIALWVIIAGSVIYVVFFAIISLFYDKEDHIAAHAAALSNKQCRFLILYPAYKEDRVIINAVENFLLQDYPTTHYTVAVISDHMRPETNDYLRQLPITLLEPVFEKSSKANAMQYAINEVKGYFDQVVILDADNVVRPDFLSQLNILCTIYDAIQCHRCAKNANNDVAVLDGASEEINNTIFRKAHNRLGLSSALIGSGMCFNYELFKKNVFQLSTAGEDREMEALLLHQEVFIKYAPEIHVFDEKVSNQDNFQRQKTIQQALIPRSILIVLLAGISILMTIFMPSWCEKWWILFALLAIALFIAIPKQLRFRSFGKVLAIPGLVLRMLKNLLHIDHKNTDFIHTQHG